MDERGRRADLHALRKTFGTALVLNGEQPRVVMEAMRHIDLKLTMKLYTDAGQLPVGAALARLPWNEGIKSEEEKSVWTLLELQPSDEGNWRGFSQTNK